MSARTEDDDIRFGWEFEESGLWIHDDDQGEAEHTAEFVQAFLVQWRPTAVVYFTWAATRDKPLLDAYGGGAVVITANEMDWMSADVWAFNRSVELGATTAVAANI